MIVGWVVWAIVAALLVMIVGTGFLLLWLRRHRPKAVQNQLTFVPEKKLSLIFCFCLLWAITSTIPFLVATTGFASRYANQSAFPINLILLLALRFIVLDGRNK
jgi:uncharacterized iron-regulated membrane protein